METLDAKGHSGGLLTAWSPALNKVATRKLDSVIETKLNDKETRMDFTLLNVYGPFYDRKLFWEKFSLAWAKNQPNVILGGDLNLTLATGEVWGENAKQDALSSLFLDFFEKMKLVDVAPLKTEPTWRNKRGGAQAISKRLDHFMVEETLLNGNLTLKSIIETRVIWTTYQSI